MKSMKATLLIIAAALLLPSCSVLNDALECLCAPRFDNPKLDSFFTTAEQLQTAALRVDGKIEQARADLAVSLGLTATASATDIRTAYCDLFDVVTVNWEPPVCRSSIDIAVTAAAECDVAVTPGEFDVRCTGTCHGTCRASCTGSCEIPAIAAYCDGDCFGRCKAVWNDICYGTCYGTCGGDCTVMDGVTTCAGGCTGNCNGHCEFDIGEACVGECTGDCVSAITGACNAQCNGQCQGHCEGYCEGEITMPEVDADCEAEIQARAAGEIQCVPPVIEMSANPAAALEIALITRNMARIIAATAEVDAIVTALGSFETDIGSVAEAVIDGDLDATQAACAATKLDDVVDAMQDVRATLGGVVDANALFICI